MDIKTLYENTDLSMLQIATRLGLGYKRVWNYCRNHYSKPQREARHRRLLSLTKLGSANPQHGKFREEHTRYVGEVSDSKGYLMVCKPEWYTGRKRSKHIFVHHKVMCEHLGISEVPRGYCVHHCDLNPHNNHIENLVLLTVGEHSALHAALAGVTTISKESTTKWLEARRAGIRQDIV